jgi:hypothetical protein
MLTAWLEALLRQLCEVMEDLINDTKAFVVKKQTLTVAERLAELENDLEVEDEQDGEDESGSDDEAAPIYNPKNLPLGWDGKPIPYWLYKVRVVRAPLIGENVSLTRRCGCAVPRAPPRVMQLHGLSQEFECQICGDVVYRGRRAFDRHFQVGLHVVHSPCCPSAAQLSTARGVVWRFVRCAGATTRAVHASSGHPQHEALSRHHDNCRRDGAVCQAQERSRCRSVEAGCTGGVRGQ